MSQHDAYLDRMTARLGELESQIKDMAQKVVQQGERRHETQIRELEASLAAAKERLQSLRRAGAELDEEMTQSFTQSFERLNTAIGRTRASLDGRPNAA